jgi:hypothetical protein
MAKSGRPSENIAVPVKRIPLIVGGLLAGLFVLLQLVPVQRDNPPIVREPKWVSPQTRDLAKRACFDCHSNETVWPWYAYIAPLSWKVASNVQEGRAALNFSEWGIPKVSREGGEIALQGGEGGEGAEPGEVAQTLLEGRMPPADYAAQHPEAQLTSDEKKALAAGLMATLGKK